MRKDVLLVSLTPGNQESLLAAAESAGLLNDTGTIDESIEAVVCDCIERFCIVVFANANANVVDVNTLTERVSAMKRIKDAYVGKPIVIHIDHAIFNAVSLISGCLSVSTGVLINEIVRWALRDEPKTRKNYTLLNTTKDYKKTMDRLYGAIKASGKKIFHNNGTEHDTIECSVLMCDEDQPYYSVGQEVRWLNPNVVGCPLENLQDYKYRKWTIDTVVDDESVAIRSNALRFVVKKSEIEHISKQRCSMCHEEYPVGHFFAHPTGYYIGVCRDCFKKDYDSACSRAKRIKASFEVFNKLGFEPLVPIKQADVVKAFSKINLSAASAAGHISAAFTGGMLTDNGKLGAGRELIVNATEFTPCCGVDHSRIIYLFGSDEYETGISEDRDALDVEGSVSKENVSETVPVSDVFEEKEHISSKDEAAEQEDISPESAEVDTDASEGKEAAEMGECDFYLERLTDMLNSLLLPAGGDAYEKFSKCTIFVRHSCGGLIEEITGAEFLKRVDERGFLEPHEFDIVYRFCRDEDGIINDVLFAGVAFYRWTAACRWLFPEDDSRHLSEVSHKNLLASVKTLGDYSLEELIEELKARGCRGRIRVPVQTPATKVFRERIKM